MIDLAPIATGRTANLFMEDAVMLHVFEHIRDARILVIGGAGSIGSEVVRQLAMHHPAVLDIVDIDENGLVDVLRDLHGAGTFFVGVHTLACDFTTNLFQHFLASRPAYTLILNLAAIKHVRSERDAYSLARMFHINVLGPARLPPCFSVSTDKAANPASFMGASKRIMEDAILYNSGTSARFANVAFSRGSLLDGWTRWFARGWPLAVPRGVRRYFISVQEAALLCIIAAVASPAGRLLVPCTLPAPVDLVDVLFAFLQAKGFEPVVYLDVAEARSQARLAGHYPVVITPRNTPGEKPCEEFSGFGDTVTRFSPHLDQVSPVRLRADSVTTLLACVQDYANCPPEAGLLATSVMACVPWFAHCDGTGILDTRL